MLNKDSLELACKALANSLKIDIKVAQFHLANSFYGSSWVKLKTEVEQGKSRFQNMSPIAIKELLEEMALSFSINLNVNNSIASELVQSIEPLTQSNPRSLSVNLDEHSNGEYVDIAELFELIGDTEDMFKAFKQMVDEDHEITDIFGGLEGSADLESQLRLSLPVHTSNYFDILTHLVNWNLDGDTLSSTYTPYSHSFYLNSALYGQVPVYLFSYLTTPGDNQDLLHNNVKDKLAKNNKTALLIFRAPTFKELNGHIYTVVGAFYANAYWSYILLCAIPPDEQHKLIGPNNDDLENPILDTSFTTQVCEEIPTNLIYFSAISDGVLEEGLINIKEETLLFKGESGWVSHVYYPI